jgi:single-stranded-DNA-specific exonuclease
LAATAPPPGPFGQGNPEPLFVADRLQVVDKKVVGRSHLKLRLQGGAEAIGFDMGHLVEQVSGQVDAAFCLELNIFSGRRTLQLRLRDLRPSDSGAR